MHRTTLSLAGSILAFALPGCTLDSPVDPAGLFGPINNALEDVQRAVENAVADPLGNRPEPILIGGDSERIFYATNLGDIRIRFPGPTNELIIPGLLGPSNLYVHENRERRLLRPLIPAGALSSLSTDGDLVAYVWNTDFESGAVTQRVRLGSLSVVADRTILETPTADGEIVTDLRLTPGRLVMVLAPVAEIGASRILVQSTLDDSPDGSFFGGFIRALDLRGTRLVYVNRTDVGDNLHLVDLVSGDDRVVAASDQTIPDVYLTNNYIVWSEVARDGDPLRILAYDLVNDAIVVWTDAVRGRLAGANDRYWITQRIERRDRGTEIVIIERHESGAATRRLADFRNDGRAGQTRVLGDRVVFVNADRKIVVVPLDGSGRFNFNPF